MKDKNDCDPFAEFTLGDSPRAILCLHGLGCAPVMFYEIGTELAAAGYTVRSILLPGHGTTLKDFSETPWTAWYDRAVREFDALAGKYQTVSVIGFSIGSMLGIKLASEKKVERLALLGAPYYIVRKWFPLRRILKIGMLYVEKVSMLRMRRRYLTPAGWKRYRTPLAAYYPLKTVETTADLVDHVRPLAEKVTCPTLIIVSRCDLSADHRGGQALMEKIPASEKRLVRLNWSHHEMLQGCRRSTVKHEIRGFFGM